ncbi:hypothetical protein LTR60_005805, partial [Cryomyces antarcticus]
MARWGRLRTQPNIQILRNLKLKKTRRLLLAPYSRASPVANPNPKMAFSFGFSGDDIDAESSGDVQAGAAAPTAAAAVAQTGVERQQPALMEARALDVDELLSTLPSKISYSSIEIVSPKERRLLIPRRELFDIRMQLMAEDGGGDDADATLAGIDSSDIKTNVYEGGFKSW